MDLSSHLCVWSSDPSLPIFVSDDLPNVRLDMTVDGQVAIRRGRVIRVVGDVGCRLALEGQSPSHERGALLAFM